MAAASSGARVEVASSRTSTDRVWANPDGTFTSESFTGPNWTTDVNGNWVEIDTSLERGTDGLVRPLAAAVDIELSGAKAAGSSTPLASIEVSKESLGALADAWSDPQAPAPAADVADANAASFAVGYAGALPAPTLVENEATYADVSPGRDLRVVALPSGVETFVDIKARPAQIPAAGVEISLPISTKGLTVAEDGDGGLVVKNASTGEVVGSTPPAHIWDASAHPVTGDSVHVLEVPTDLRKTASGWNVVATVPASYFDTEGLTYPVTVDPSATLAPSKDTFVQAGDDALSFGTYPHMNVGTYDGGVHVARAYLSFVMGYAPYLYDPSDDTTVVDSAWLKVWEYDANSCTPSDLYIRRLTSTFGESSTWTTRPTQSGVISTVSDARIAGATGACTESWVDSIYGTDVSGIVQGWANADYTNYGFALTASETSSTGWKRFASSEYPNSAKRPSLVVTYHHIPKVPTTLTVAGLTGGVVADATPDVRATVKDLDGGSPRAYIEVWQGTTKSWSGYSSTTPSGKATPWKTIGGMVDGGTYTVKVWANDGTNTSSAPATTTVKVDTTAPAAPTVASSFAAGAWAGTDAGTFTLTSTSTDVTAWEWTTDGISWTPVVLTGSTTPSLSMPGGWTSAQFRAIDKAGNKSTPTTYTFGVPAVTQPTDEGTTLRYLPLTAQGPSSATAVRFQYRAATTDPWTDIPASAVKLGQSAITWPVATVANGSADAAPAGLVWDMPATLATDASVQLQAVFTGGTTTTTVNAAAARLDSHAYGLSYATTDTPAGPVSLLTGNLAVSGSDASVVSFGGGLGVTRTFNTIDPGFRTTATPTSVTTKALTSNVATLTTGAAHGLAVNDVVVVAGVDATFNGTFTVTAVPTSTTFSYARTATNVASTSVSPAGSVARTSAPFGPGWATSLASSQSDWAAADDLGTQIRLTDSDGGLWYFTKTSTGYAATADAVTAGLTLTRSGTGALRALTLKDPDGGTVIFGPVNGTWTGTASLTTPDGYRVTSTQQAGVPGTSSFMYNGDGTPLALFAPVPAGVTCSTTSVSLGCRLLQFTYADVDATAAVANRLTKVTFKTTNTAGTATIAVDVACYTYDATAGYRLSQVWDPRLGGTSGWSTTCGTPVLATTYGYDGTGRISSITPPGINPVTLAYTGAKLTSATQAISGTNLTTTIGYDAFDVTTGTTLADRPDLSTARVDDWGQTDLPLTAAVVFGPGDTVSPTDLRDGTVYGIDADGRIVNTASYSGTGQDGWRVDTTEYDPNGNTIRALSAGARDRALNPASYTEELTGLGLTAAASADIAAALDTRNLYAADGVDLTDTYGPARLVAIPGSSDPVAARPHVKNTYGTIDYPIATPASWTADGPAHSIVRTTESASLSLAATPVNETDTTETRYAYGLSSTDHPGWDLRQPMATTVENGTTDITTVTRFDANGNVIEQRQPSATVAADPGTRVTTYFTAGAHNPATCTSTAWFGQVCKIGPGAQPTTSGLPGLPVTTYTYDALLRPTVTTETVTPAGGGTSTRTTTTTYRNSGASAQVDTVAITGGVGTAVPTTSYGYDSATGLPTTVSNGTSTLTTGYDALGRVTSYSEGATSPNVITAYDTSGRIASRTWKTDATNVLASATYGYDTTAGEHRDLLTSITDSGLSGPITGTYGAGGELTQQVLPGGLTRSFSTDATGDTVATAWTQGTDLFLADSQLSDIHGRWQIEELAGAHPGWTERDYAYDPAGRLTQTAEKRTDACITRTYALDINSNRTGSSTYPDAGAGCTTATSPLTAQSLNYDNADRLLPSGSASGIAYDAWGRTTTLPGALTATASSGDATIGYYANDLVRSTGQGTTTRTWTLDPATRLAAMGSSGAGSLALTNHYSDSSGDSPAWTTDSDSAGVVTSRRYVNGLGGLAAEIATVGSSTSVVVQLSGLHGDVLRSTSLAATGAPDGPAVDADEFGTVRDVDGASSTGPRYGWLGGKQRAADGGSTGLVLMGVRLYAPLAGRFLSVDPVYGGNATPYNYPSDSVNDFDLDGRCVGAGWMKICRWLWHQAVAAHKHAVFSWGGCVGYCFGVWYQGGTFGGSLGAGGFSAPGPSIGYARLRASQRRDGWYAFGSVLGPYYSHHSDHGQRQRNNWEVGSSRYGWGFGFGGMYQRTVGRFPWAS